MTEKREYIIRALLILAAMGLFSLGGYLIYSAITQALHHV